MRTTHLLYLIISLTICHSSLSFASAPPEELNGVGVKEHIGDQIPLQEFTFRDESGKSVAFSNYFNKDRPVILALIYYECPNLCNLILNGLLESMKKLDWTTGNQFDLVAVSINPKETPELALKKKNKYLQAYGRPNAEKGWHFLTGPEEQVRSLASHIGFQYRYDEKTKQYLHTAALFVLTPQGKISNYLYGVSFFTKNLRFSLLDASQGKIGTVVDRVLLFCFHFDPNKNSYTFRMWRVVQIILVIQVMVLGGLLFVLWRKERKPLNQK